ncbi:MAG: glycosyltransferase, partial [Acidobacteria bacterium]
PNESLPFVYSAADVFVMPSLQEAFGQTALEALSCGTPVAGFAAGGIPEIVQDGKTGLLSPVGAVDGLRDSIAHLLLNPSIAHGMSVEGRRWAVEHFSLEEQAAKYAELYDSILSRQSSLTSKRGFRELSCGS